VLSPTGKHLVPLGAPPWRKSSILPGRAQHKALSDAALELTSGASHDAQMMARIEPSAMILVPSIKGISHNPKEATDPGDLAFGAQVLLQVVEDCLAVPLGEAP